MAASRLTKTPEQATWHVLGGGAVGSLFAAYLQRSGASVTLLPRDSTDSGKRKIVNGPANGSYTFSCSRPSDDEGIDALLVTTKAYDVRAALHSVRHRLHKDTTILLLVNGMGLREELAPLALAGNFYLATTTEGVHRRDISHLVHAGRGVTRVGCQGGQAPAWFSLWQAGIPDCHWESDIEAALWLKLAINCAINPLTAIHACRNGDLLTRRAEVAELCTEIAAVCLAMGYDLLASELEDRVFEVITGTATNRSSMLQDVAAGRPTEIAYLTGYLVDRARALDIEVPANGRVLEQVKALA